MTGAGATKLHVPERAGRARSKDGVPTRHGGGSGGAARAVPRPAPDQPSHTAGSFRGVAGGG